MISLLLLAGPVIDAGVEPTTAIGAALAAVVAVMTGLQTNEVHKLRLELGTKVKDLEVRVTVLEKKKPRRRAQASVTRGARPRSDVHPQVPL